jgi:glyoxylase-like metal-dependent hydrolase (beta-lactamase superfamily II)
MRRLVFLACLLSSPAAWAADYQIYAIRYGTSPQFPLSNLVMGAPSEEKVDIALVIWLVRGEGRTLLVDTGFHRDKWFERFRITDYLRPDQTLVPLGIKPEDVTDIAISHAHWDHLGGIDLFPKANLWIQKREYEYYTGEAWQTDGRHGGIDPEDVLALVRVNTEGRLRWIDGDDVEFLPGIRAYTGSRHTYASQYFRVLGPPSFVLASDNCYLYRNLETRAASATFSEADRQGNIAAQARMIELAGARERVVPGHDPLQFARFPSDGRVARIK